MARRPGRGDHGEVTPEDRYVLHPGDLLFWEDFDEAGRSIGAPLRVGEDGLDLWFQFAPMPWHECPGDQRGVRVPEAEAILRGEIEAPFTGYIYKLLDSATGQRFADPHIRT